MLMAGDIITILFLAPRQADLLCTAGLNSP